jgi:hypothetical protein
MTRRANIRRALGALTLAWLASPRAAEACAACFGRSDSPMAKGMNMGIMTLLFVIMSVLFGIAIFFAYILRRAARLERERLANDTAADLDGALSHTVSQLTPLSPHGH